MSTNTGFAPHATIAFEVIIHEKGVVITSSFYLIPKDFKAKYKPLLPEATPRV